MKKNLYYFDAFHGQVFVDCDANFVRYVHENDARWSVYHDFIMKFFDVGSVIRVPLPKGMDPFRDVDNIEGFVKANKAALSAAIDDFLDDQ